MSSGWAAVHADPTLRKLLHSGLKRKKQPEEKLLSDIKAYIGEHIGLAEDFQKLLGISSVEEKVAFNLLALFTHYQGTNRAQITAVVGLDPIYKE